MKSGVTRAALATLRHRIGLASCDAIPSEIQRGPPGHPRVPVICDLNGLKQSVGAVALVYRIQGSRVLPGRRRRCFLTLTALPRRRGLRTAVETPEKLVTYPAPWTKGGDTPPVTVTRDLSIYHARITGFCFDRSRPTARRELVNRVRRLA